MKKIIAGLLTLLALLATPSLVPAQPLDPSPFGLMGYPYSHVRKESDAFAKAGAHMDLYRLTGARWDRRDFWWSVVEPEKGRWEWSYFDRAMQDFRENDVNLLVILCYGSAWKGDAPSSEEEIRDFGEYAFQMVNRYKNHVKHWEVWNEPNILPFWSPKPDPATYSRLLQEVYTRAKEADPDCVVVGGAMAGADAEFLRRIYIGGAKGYFDVLSYHTYGNNPTRASQQKEIDDLRGVMREFGDDKPLWLTETGIYTGPAGVTEQEQAERIVRSSLLWVSMGIERIYQLTLKDWTDDPNADDASSFRGLAHASGAAKPSFYAFRTMCNLLGDKQFVGDVSLHADAEFLLFAADSEAILVAWSRTGEPVPCTVPTGSRSILLHDLYGERELVTAGRTEGTPNDEAVYGIALTSSPVYIEGVGEEIRFGAGWSTGTSPATATAGDSVNLEFAFRPTLSGVDQITLVVEENPAFEILAPKASYPVPNSGRLDIPIRIEATMRPGSLPFAYQVSARYGDTTVGPVRLVGAIDVRSAFDLAFAPIQRLTIPRAVMNLDLTNNSADARDLTIFVSGPSIDATPTEREFPVASLPQGAVAMPIVVQLDELASGHAYPITARLLSADGGEVTAETTFRLLKAVRLGSPITIDGKLDDWNVYTPNIRPDMLREVDFNPNLNGGAEDISARGWLAWDAESVYLTLEITDDAQHFPENNVVWDFDSLQIAIDGRNDAVGGTPFDRNDYEIEVALLRDGTPLVYATQYPEGFIADVVEEESEVAIVANPDAGTVIYEMRMPQAILPSLMLADGAVFGFSFIVNDNDKGGRHDREGWLELTPGIGYGKDPVNYYDVVLWPDSGIR